ncbi:MAG: 7-carboxy-7-deazaguanine synthase QueE [Nitrospirota bacterium]
MKISEIYYTIQGESSLAGFPFVFIRTSGCNLTCKWCDTQYAYYDGEEVIIEEIAERVKRYNCKRAVITGGEPLLQKEIYPLTEMLLREGYILSVETNGSLDISRLDKRIKIVMDIKCPDSGMSEKMLWENIDVLMEKDEVKFVIANYSDYRWAIEKINKYSINNRCQVIFSPVFGVMDPRYLAEYIIQDKIAVRLQLQMHKYIWQPEKRGV